MFSIKSGGSRHARGQMCQLQPQTGNGSFPATKHQMPTLRNAQFLESPYEPRTRVPTSALEERKPPWRSEEHTSELQSPCNIVCRLLLEKKNNMPIADR